MPGTPEEASQRQSPVLGLGESAKTALFFAEDEARHLGHDYIGTEHILLGLMRMPSEVQADQPPDPACQALTEMGVHINKVRSAVEFIVGRGDRPVRGSLSITPRSMKVIQLAFEEERRLHLEFERVGIKVSGRPESLHLLLGLVREGEGIAASVLESLGVRLERLRTKALDPVRILAEQIRLQEEKEQRARFNAANELTSVVAAVVENPSLTWDQRLEFGARIEALVAEFKPKDLGQG